MKLFNSHIRSRFHLICHQRSLNSLSWSMKYDERFVCLRLFWSSISTIISRAICFSLCKLIEWKCIVLYHNFFSFAQECLLLTTWKDYTIQEILHIWDFLRQRFECGFFTFSNHDVCIRLFQGICCQSRNIYIWNFLDETRNPNSITFPCTDFNLRSQYVYLSSFIYLQPSNEFIGRTRLRQWVL